jgi:hypothetical protein
MSCSLKSAPHTATALAETVVRVQTNIRPTTRNVSRKYGRRHVPALIQQGFLTAANCTEMKVCWLN